MQNLGKTPSCLQLVWREPGEGQSCPAADLWGSWQEQLHIYADMHKLTYMHTHSHPHHSQRSSMCLVSGKIRSQSTLLIKAPLKRLTYLAYLGEKKVSTFQAYFVLFIFHFILLSARHMHFQVKENIWSELHLMHHEGILCAPAPTDTIETVKWTFPVYIFPLHTLYFSFGICFYCFASLPSSTYSPFSLFKQPHPLLLPPTTNPQNKTKTMEIGSQGVCKSWDLFLGNPIMQRCCLVVFGSWASVWYFNIVNDNSLVCNSRSLLWLLYNGATLHFPLQLFVETWQPHLLPSNSSVTVSQSGGDNNEGHSGHSLPGGERYSPGWVMVPAGHRVAISPWGYGMAALAWHLQHMHLHIPVRTLYVSIHTASLVDPHTPSPPESLWWRHHLAHCNSLLPQRQPSYKQNNPPKTLSGETLLPTQRDVFVQRASASRAHRDFPPPLCIHCTETIHDIFQKFPTYSLNTNAFHLRIHLSL